MAGKLRKAAECFESAGGISTIFFNNGLGLDLIDYLVKTQRILYIITVNIFSGNSRLIWLI